MTTFRAYMMCASHQLTGSSTQQFDLPFVRVSGLAPDFALCSTDGVFYYVTSVYTTTSGVVVNVANPGLARMGIALCCFVTYNYTTPDE